MKVLGDIKELLQRVNLIWNTNNQSIMKTSKISQLLIVFYFIALTGCSVDDSNGSSYVEKCWTIIDVNTGVPITTAILNITFNGYQGVDFRKYIESDENGKACTYLFPRNSIIRANVYAPGYLENFFNGYLPDVIKLTPLGE